MSHDIASIAVTLPPPVHVAVSSLGVQGPPGEPGPPGPAGPAGPPGTAGLHAATHYVGGADALAGSLAATDVRVGANPAQSGAVRLATNSAIKARDAGNTADLNVVTHAGTYVVYGEQEVAATIVDGVTVQLRPAGASYVFDTLGPRADSDGDRHLGYTNARWKQVHVAEAVNVGTNPAQTGAVRLANEQEIKARNATNDGDLTLLEIDSANRTQIGPLTGGGSTFINGAGVVLRYGGSGAAAINVDSLGIYPETANTGQLGYPTKRFTTLNLATGISLKETAAQGNADADCATLWCEDNGAGKTRLMVRFATGAAIQIAIQV